MAKTAEQLIDWTYRNRAGVLKDRDLLDILTYFKEAADGGIVWHFETPNQEVSGIVLAKLNHSKRTAYVSYCRLTAKGLLKQAFDRFKSLYPGYTLTADRKGKAVTYNLITK